jgi:hypothetical protein
VDIKERCQSMHDQAREYKQHMWDHHGERDVNAMAAMGLEGEPEPFDLQLEYAAEIVGKVTAGNFRYGDLLASMLRGVFYPGIKGHPALPKQWRQYGGKDPLWVCFASDGYTTSVPTVEEAEAFMKGDLQADFRNNPESDVVECFTTVLWEVNAVKGIDVVAVRQTYGIDDGGIMTWNEPEVVYEATDSPPDIGMHVHECVWTALREKVTGDDPS